VIMPSLALPWSCNVTLQNGNSVHGDRLPAKQTHHAAGRLIGLPRAIRLRPALGPLKLVDKELQ
jgi:hypothetical protein